MENKLPEGWEWKKLGEICTLKGGFAFKSKEYKEKGIPLLRISNIADNKVSFERDTVFLEEHYKEEFKEYLVSSGDILIALSGATTGKYGIYEGKEDVLLNQRVACLKFNFRSSVNLRYVYYYLKILQDDILRKADGAAQPNISTSKISDYLIAFPPLETQQKIVSILEKAEETKKLRAQADELTQQFLQSVFLEMFGDPMTNPKKWKEIKLKEISEIVSGVTKGRKLDGKSTVFVPYLRVANVQDGFLDLTEIKDIEVLPSDVEKYALQNGDILLTEGGDPDKLGRGAVWNEQISKCIHQNHIFRVRVNREYLVPEYLSMLIGSAYGKMYFLKSAKQTTGIASINSAQLKNFPALIAPLDLQLKFAEICRQIEKTTGSQKQSSLEINNLFDALMQKAFTGELVS